MAGKIIIRVEEISKTLRAGKLVVAVLLQIRQPLLRISSTMPQLRIKEATTRQSSASFDPSPSKAMHSAIKSGDIIYNKGQGVPENYAEALKWLGLAANKGNAEAQFDLGVMYAEGHGVPQDYAEALKLFRLAADQGDAEAQYNIAVMYRDGNGVLRDFAAALKGFRLAADQGLATAQTNLGVMYEKGKEYRKTTLRLWRWHRLAANQGLAVAQHNLGLMYAAGRGVSKDIVGAYMWFSLSASQGEQNAVRDRDKAAGLMTPAQIAEAEKLARE